MADIVYDPETGGTKVAAPEAAPLPNGWRGPIAKLDGPTGDGRWLATPESGVRTRAYPLTLTNRHVGDPTGYPTIGSVDRAWVQDGLLYGEGKLDTGGAEGAEYARQLAAGMGNQVSIDPDQVEAEHRLKLTDGTDVTDQYTAALEDYLASLEGDDPVAIPSEPSNFQWGDQWPPRDDNGEPHEVNEVMQFSDWRLAGLAAVPVAAYTEARIEPVYDYTPSQALPSDAIVSATNPVRDIVVGLPSDVADNDDPTQLPKACMCADCGCGGAGMSGQCCATMTTATKVLELHNQGLLTAGEVREATGFAKGTPQDCECDQNDCDCEPESDALPNENIVSATPLGTGDTSPHGAVNPSYQTPNVTLPENGKTDDVSMPVVRTSTGGAFANSSMIALRPARPRTFASPSKAARSPEDLHVTLAHLGDGRHSDEIHAAGHRAAHAAAAAIHANPKVRVSGYGHLGDPENPATVLFLNGKGIADAHAAAHEHLAEHYESGALPAQHPQHIPHMTLGYGVPLAHAKMFMGREFSLDSATYDNQMTSFSYNARTASDHAAARDGQIQRKHGASEPRNGGDHYTTKKHAAPAKSGIVAASAGGQVFHREFFEAVAGGPTPPTITEDGHFFGHVRLNGTCYQYGGGQGNGGRCVEPPPSACGYAKFMVHGAKMDDGSIMSVGAITFGDGHVSRGGLEASRKHYDDVATVAAKVVAVDDDWGTWVTGEVLDSVADRAYDLLLAPLSGHWEPDADNRNRLEMLAAHIVVTPGYRPAARIVAAFGEDGEETEGILLTEDFTQIVASVPEDEPMPTPRADVLKALADLERGKELAKKLGIDVQAELAKRQAAIVASGGGMAIADPGTAWDGGGAAGRMLDRATKNGKIDVGMAGQGFLGHRNDGSNRTDWALPFCDVRGGALEIIPRGASAAAGRLNQTQGIDQGAAKSRLAGVYSRIHAKYPDWPASPGE